MKSMLYQSGFTLLELLCTVAILGLAVSTASINFSEVTASFSRAASREQLSADLRRARNEALSSGARLVMSIAADGNSYELGYDYLPFSNPAVAEIALFKRNLPENTTISVADTIIFDARGYLIDDVGTLNSVVVTLRNNGNSFYAGTVYPAGFIE